MPTPQIYRVSQKLTYTRTDNFSSNITLPIVYMIGSSNAAGPSRERGGEVSDTAHASLMIAIGDVNQRGVGIK